MSVAGSNAAATPEPTSVNINFTDPAPVVAVPASAPVENSSEHSYPFWLICFNPLSSESLHPEQILNEESLFERLRQLTQAHRDNPRFEIRIVRGELWHISKGPVRYLVSPDLKRHVPIYLPSEDAVEVDWTGRLFDEQE